MPAPSMTRFIVRGHRIGGYTIAVEGLLDATSASSLRCLLVDLQRDRVTLDLAGCTGVTDDAVAALAKAARVAEAHGGDVRLRPTSDANGTAERERERAEPAERALTRRSLSPAECRSLLAGESIGRIAVTRSGIPHVVPVNYAVVDGAVVFRTVSGDDLGAVGPGEPVSFEADGFHHAPRMGWSVTVSGRTALVTDEGELERVRGRLDGWAAPSTGATVRILPDLVSGSLLSDASVAVTETPFERALVGSSAR